LLRQKLFGSHHVNQLFPRKFDAQRTKTSGFILQHLTFYSVNLQRSFWFLPFFNSLPNTDELGSVLRVETW